MFASITLCSALFGLFLVPPLLVTARKRAANAWLAAFVGCMSALAMADYASATHLYSRYPALLGWFDWPLAGLGGTFYLYVLGVSGQFRRTQLWHLLPLALFAGWLVRLRLVVPVDTLLANMDPARHPGFQPVLLAFQLVVAAYAIASLRRLGQYQRILHDHHANTAQLDLTWLRVLTVAMCGQFLLWLPLSLTGPDWAPVFDLSRVVILYLLGWFGLRQSAVFVPPRTRTETRADGDQWAQPPPEQARPAARVAGQKYARSGMTGQASALIGQRLTQRMEVDRIYENPDLTLNELATRIGASPQLVSQHLNEVLGMSFFEYINNARVSAVQALMLQAEYRNHGLLDLAFMAGFNSKSAFNASFKRLTGMTPSAWKQQQVVSASGSAEQCDDTCSHAGLGEAVRSA